MIIKSKYKVARRLGAPLFEKTQTAKYALRQERKDKGAWRPKSDFGLQMLEKQKARFAYGINERQFSKYVKESVADKSNTQTTLYGRLEKRLDNVVYRIGWAPTRSAARQMVAHGHVRVGTKAVRVPSYEVGAKDIVSIRPASVNKGPFKVVAEKAKEVKVPEWIAYDAEKKEAKVVGMPKYSPKEAYFDLGAVVEFYSR